MALHYFLACWVVTCALEAAHPVEKYSLVGQKLHLNPAVPEQPKYILWKHNGNKVVEFDGKEESVYGQYHNRVTLDWISAELDITNLQEEDRGLYELESELADQVHFFKFQLTVIGTVAKPTISCTQNSSSADAHQAWARLTCSAEPTQPRSSITYEWESSGKVVHGPELTISLEDKHNDKIHTCRARNPLSSETTTFMAKDCNSDNILLIGLLVTGAILFLLAGVAAGIFFCKGKHKACLANGKRNDVEKRSQGEEMGEDKEKRHLLGGAPTLPSHQPLRSLAPADTGEDSEDKTPQGKVKGMIARIEQKSGGVSAPQSSEGLSVVKSKRATPTPPNQSHPGRKPSLTDIKQDSGDTEGDQVTELSDTDEGNVSDPVCRLVFIEDSPASQEPSSSSGSKKKRALYPPSLRKPLSPSQDENNLSSNHKGDTDGDQVTEPSDPGESNVPEPTCQLNFDEFPDEESIIVQPKSENKEDEKEDSTPATDMSLSALRPSSKHSPDERSKDAAEDQDEDVRESLSPGSEKGPQPGSSLKKTPPAPPPRPSKTPSVSHNLSSDHKGDMDGDQVTEPSDTGGSHVPDHTCQLESATVPQQPKSEKEEDKRVEAKSPPASPPSSPEPHSTRDASDADKDADVRESPSPGSEKRAETDESHEEEQPSSNSPSPELDSSMPQEETHPSDDKQTDVDKTASGDNSESDREETEEDLYSSLSRSATPIVTKTDNSKTNELEESPNAASAQEVESESRHKPDESKGQLDNNTAEEDELQSKTDEKNEDVSDSKNAVI